jgi:hypothetical protein
VGLCPVRENRSAEKHGRCVSGFPGAVVCGGSPKPAMVVNHRRLLVVCISLAFIAVVATNPCGAQEPFRLTPSAKFLVGMGSGYVFISGDLLVPAGGRAGSGTRVDLMADLGVDRAEATSLSFQTAILDRHLIDLDYMMLQPTGFSKPSHAFLFHNRTYKPGVALETRLDLNWVRWSYGYKAAISSSWWVAPRVGAHYVRCSTTVNGDTEESGIMSNTRSLDCTFPVLGLESRYLYPYGWDIGVELEGVYLLDRGFLSSACISANWEVHPDVVLTLSASHRFAESTENNQVLNNHWSYQLSGVSAAIRFGF